MIGRWKGKYEYRILKGYENANLSSVEFNIEIVDLKNDTFSGMVEDNSEMGGTPGIGQIRGSRDGNSIVFEKLMPINSGYYPNGGRKINKNRRHPTLIYTGILDSGLMTISGEWKFKKSKFMWIGILPWWYDLGSGTFTMSKMNIL